MTCVEEAIDAMTAAQSHFLVVDDQCITRLIVINLLNALGYLHVSEAEDGQQALDLLRCGDAAGMPVSCVISDWNMPVIDGLTLLRTIRASDALRHLPVLIMTADTGANTIDTAMQAGADGFIDKQSLNADSLNAMLDKILTQ
jgi:two-component system chemotaxis response regulator CheY